MMQEQRVVNKRVRMVVTVLVGMTAAFILMKYGIRRQVLGVDSGRFEVMGTLAQVKVRTEDEELGRQAIRSAQAAVEEVEQLMSLYREDSELVKVNAAAGEGPVEVSAELYHVLEKSLYYSKLTHGAFDVTVRPLIMLWKKAADEGREPSSAEIAEVLEVVGYQKVILTRTEVPGARGRYEVELSRGGMVVDLNAIAKGYAVDKALSALKLEGITGALVEVGGEVACFGSYGPDDPWELGIQDPFAAGTDEPWRDEVGWTIRPGDAAVATSGNYRQYIEIQGVRHNHILDPRTGRPADRVPSVTVWGPDCLGADALATGLSVLGPEEGLAIVEGLAGTEALIIMGGRERPELFRTSGFEMTAVE